MDTLRLAEKIAIYAIVLPSRCKIIESRCISAELSLRFDFVSAIVPFQIILLFVFLPLLCSFPLANGVVASVLVNELEILLD